ncbi:MAG: hypothetical protein PHW96_03975 [Candidatus Nanoarchaeia archaeon]|nr:hypothetical protein [Candidatus Nanoarchaeia archaeon]
MNTEIITSYTPKLISRNQEFFCTGKVSAKRTKCESFEEVTIERITSGLAGMLDDVLNLVNSVYENDSKVRHSSSTVEFKLSPLTCRFNPEKIFNCNPSDSIFDDILYRKFLMDKNENPIFYDFKGHKTKSELHYLVRLEEELSCCFGNISNLIDILQRKVLYRLGVDFFVLTRIEQSIDIVKTIEEKDGQLVLSGELESSLCLSGKTELEPY